MINSFVINCLSRRNHHRMTQGADKETNWSKLI
nr:MAG TPA_asm: hypothetical protein [Caudoviricetes sp.]